MVPGHSDRAVADTCVLSNFGLTRKLRLLRLAFPRVLAAELSILELERGAEKRPELQAVVEACTGGAVKIIDDLTDEELGIFASLPRALGDADKAGLSIAKTRSCTLLTDDKRLRTACAEQAVSVAGTPDLLSRCIRSGSITAEGADSLLDVMETKASFFCAVRFAAGSTGQPRE